MDDAALLRHPVLRSVVLELSAPGERRDAHRRAWRGRSTPSATWSSARGTSPRPSVGPDPDVAGALEQAAGRAAGRTGYAAAAALLERAALFAEAPARSGADLLAAARMWFAAGDAPRAVAVAERLWEAEPEGPLRAEAAHLWGFLTMLSSRAEDAFVLLAREARRARAHDPAKAAQMLCDAGLANAMSGRCREALRSMQEAASYVPLDEAPQLIGSLAAGLTLAGRAREARPLFARAERYLEAVEPLSPEGQTVVLSLTPRTWLGEFDAAERHVRRWLDVGPRGRVPRLRRLPAGVRRRDRLPARALARRASPAPSRRCAHSRRPARRARSPSPSSRSPRSRPGSAARRTAGPTRSRPWRSGAPSAWARSGCTTPSPSGLLAQGTGRPDTVVELLEPIVDYTAEQGLGEPATVMWQPELVEAYVRLGRTVDARRALATLAEQADRTGGAWSRAAASRCRGLLDDDFDRHFTEALRLHDLTPMPFERARTELAYGARLRRARRRAEGRELLRRALATFEELGAAPWARRTREEIAASGAGLPRREAPPSDELSPRELQVAVIVAEGLTNREVAARLFLSEKTWSATWAASTASSACARAPSWRAASPVEPRPAGIRASRRPPPPGGEPTISIVSQ